jgi:hypothetical protein
MKILALILLSLNFAYASFIPLKDSPKWQIELSKTANCVLSDPAFLTEVATIPKFDYSKATGLEVSLSLQKPMEATLTTYSPKLWNWASKVIAYRNVNSNIIHFNVRKNPRPTPEMVNTCMHELLHLLGYEHNGNGPENAGKQFTVNYYVGRIAEKYVKDCL